MYKKHNYSQTQLANFYLPFGGKLRKDNRWVILSEKIPWASIESLYAENFKSKDGKLAYNSRIAFGALLIKEKLGISDRETVEQIAENHYLQYFLGFTEYRDKIPFSHSLMTHFRKRFDKKLLSSINDEIVINELVEKNNSKENDDESKNKGKLIVDATCTPSDIAYPLDLNLLNAAREKTEDIIDTLHKPFVGKKQKVRTYRNKARKDYLKVAKKKKAGRNIIRKAIRKQLGYLDRNIKNIDNLAAKSRLSLLSKRQYRNLLVVSELYRQQLEMYQRRTHTIPGRIVSISQPHIRPIVRGKAKNKVEFGAKVSASIIDGFIFADRISWDNFNEGNDLAMQIEEYHRRMGFYPESVHADKIYITMKNREYCKNRGIRISGVPLGRPRKETVENADEIKAKKKQLRDDEISRIPIEGKFGQGKRRFGLGLIMSKLAKTAEVSIMITLIVMNLEKITRSFLCLIFTSIKCGQKNLISAIIRIQITLKVVFKLMTTEQRGKKIKFAGS